MFVVFGASGNTGSIVASTLLERGKKVRVVARDASKVAGLANKGAEVFQGDALDAASVAKALEGAEGAYFLVPPDFSSTDSLARGRKIVDAYAGALSRAAVKHAVLLSSAGADAEGTGLIETVHYAEPVLAKTKTPFTFVRAAYFMENLLGFAQPMKGDGVPIPMVATRDIGRVSAEALLAPTSQTEIIELSGPKEYSFVDAAAEASKILGRPVNATPLPIDALVPAIRAMGASEDVATLYREMTEASKSGKVRFHGTHKSVRGATALGEVLRAGLA
ncbi:MAG TPA: NmrA family NAD(P)-binding protein [Polyangiaceae bacterium]|nr:NmrA family NAD(P)-binding protein [Polyangiaceae bacterium]